MVRKTITTALCLVLVTAATSSAASRTGIHGRGPHAQAVMYATALDHGRRAIQVLDRLCADSQRARRCVPSHARLRHAISVAVHRPLKWVDHKQRQEGVFWVLTAIRWSPRRANFSSAWTEPGAYGCTGGSHSRFRLVDGEWVKAGGGGGYVGCP